MAIEKKALVLFYPGCIEFEIMLASELVSKEFQIEIATPDGLQHRSSTGIVYQAQHSFKNVKVSGYRCLLIPGGDTYDVFENADLDALLKEANAKDVLIGAICAAPLLLAKVGILKGCKFTHGFGDFYKDFLEQYWKGADFIDEPVVVDGTIVTAKPEAHIDFAVTIARLAGAIEDDAKADYYKNYYRGIKVSSVDSISSVL